MDPAKDRHTMISKADVTDAIAKTKEACAKACEGLAKLDCDGVRSTRYLIPHNCADAIRALTIDLAESSPGREDTDDRQ